MGLWLYRVNISHVVNAFGEGKYEDDPVGAGKEMARLVRKHLVPRNSYYERYAKSFETSKTFTKFNNTLARLYDFCDMDHVWLEQYQPEKEKKSGPTPYIRPKNNANRIAHRTA